MEIRKANLKDLDALLDNRIQFINSMRKDEEDISEEFIKDTYEYMKKHFIDDSMVIWIAVEKGQIVSTAMVCYYYLLPTISNMSGNTGYVLNVYTLPDYRGRGLATELMNKIKKDAKVRNISKLILKASDMGRPVYEKLGFEMKTNEMSCTIE